MKIRSSPKQHLWIWFFWLAAFYGSWVLLILTRDLWGVVAEHWPMAVAMAVGSYAAGSTPMGGGTVGFPILVLLFDQPAQLGRDFSLAVQAIGMTSAAIFILARRQPVAKPMLKGAVAGTTIGVPLGIFFVAPLVPPLWIKLIFAVVWGSFGLLHLWRVHEISSHKRIAGISDRWDVRAGFLIGLLAGASVVAVSGVGIDMILYTVLVLVCRADLKISIPSSVIIMAYASVIGILTKMLFSGVEPGVYGNWLAAAPVVALGAPLGAFIVSLIGRKPTLIVVAILCVVQLVWTFYREQEALGATGILIALAVIALCLFGLEKLCVFGEGIMHADEETED